MSVYSSSAPIFNFYRDDDGVFVCELTPGMVRELHGLLDDDGTREGPLGSFTVRCSDQAARECVP